jgi:protocatechuate 3,4-dioxygenase beta subunit
MGPSQVSRGLGVALVAAVTLAVVPAAGARAGATGCEPTESQGAGPIGSQAAVFPRRATFGAGYVLTGKVLRSFDCKPLAGAVIELWQAGKGGIYRPAGRASAVVGRSGTFRFQGPLPAEYEGRPGHIHLRISARGYDDVLLTHFPAPGKKTARIVVVMTSTL